MCTTIPSKRLSYLQLRGRHKLINHNLERLVAMRQGLTYYGHHHKMTWLSTFLFLAPLFSKLCLVSHCLDVFCYNQRVSYLHWPKMRKVVTWCPQIRTGLPESSLPFPLSLIHWYLYNYAYKCFLLYILSRATTLAHSHLIYIVIYLGLNLLSLAYFVSFSSFLAFLALIISFYSLTFTAGTERFSSILIIILKFTACILCLSKFHINS